MFRKRKFLEYPWCMYHIYINIGYYYVSLVILLSFGLIVYGYGFRSVAS